MITCTPFAHTRSNHISTPCPRFRVVAGWDSSLRSRYSCSSKRAAASKLRVTCSESCQLVRLRAISSYSFGYGYARVMSGPLRIYSATRRLDADSPPPAPSGGASSSPPPSALSDLASASRDRAHIEYAFAELGDSMFPSDAWAS